jgi:hypothetical protein
VEAFWVPKCLFLRVLRFCGHFLSCFQANLLPGSVEAGSCCGIRNNAYRAPVAENQWPALLLAMFKQREAIIRLLRDDDTATVELVKNQLCENGRESVADLLDLLSVDDARVTHHVRAVLGQIDAREASSELTTLCQNFPATAGWTPWNTRCSCSPALYVPGLMLKARGVASTNGEQR